MSDRLNNLKELVLNCLGMGLTDAKDAAKDLVELEHEDNRGDRLEAMVDRMAETIVDKDAVIYELRSRIDNAKNLLAEWKMFKISDDDFVDKMTDTLKG